MKKRIAVIFLAALLALLGATAAGADEQLAFSVTNAQGAPAVPGTDYSFSNINNTLIILKGVPLTIANLDPQTPTNQTICIDDRCTSDANITLAGVNIVTKGAPLAIDEAFQKDVTITLTGANTLTNSGGESAGLQKHNDSKLTIQGDGSLKATGGQDSAGIGGGQGRGSKNITIAGSAQITATGGACGAGIGGGIRHSGANISIEGSAQVIALGGSSASGSSGGAGIGGGADGSGLEIYIAGSAKVTATGGTGGAGIGGGSGGIGEQIFINSGTVTATGGEGGAGGTGGEGGSNAIVTINGGTVRAARGTFGVYDIGGEITSNVIISGGSVKADQIKDPKRGSDPVYKTAVTLENLDKDVAVTGLTVTDAAGGSLNYGIAGVKTMDGGLVYPWLKAGAVTSAAQADGADFLAKTGEIVTTADNAAKGTLYRQEMLTALTLEGSDGKRLTLNPAFDQAVTKYAAVAGSHVEKVTIVATPATGYTVTGDGEKTLNAGENTFILTVKYGASGPSRTYTIVVKKSVAGVTAEWGTDGVAYPNNGSLHAAFDAANAAQSGTTHIRLLAYAKIDSYLSLDAGKTVQLDLNGYTIDRGLTTAVGNGHVLSNAGTLTIADSRTGGKITGGKNDYHSGGIYNTGTLTIAGGAISGNAAEYGGGICSEGTLTIDGGAISGNTANSGGGIYNRGGALLIKAGSISGNTATTSGGGGVYAGGGTLTIEGGDIDKNSAQQGGGVYTNVTTTIKGSSITDNTATANGGGVCTGNGTLTIEGGDIDKNSAQEGGGVYAYVETTIKGGSITENTATEAGGGVMGKQALTIEGGEISGNSAQTNGGGIWSNSTLTLKGGTVKDNTANGGGGIYLHSVSYPATLAGGTVSGNKAATGGGVYEDSGKATVSGGFTVEGNTLLDGTTASNLYLPNGKTLISKTDFLGKIHLHTETAPTADAPVTVAVHVSGESGNIPADAFASDASGYSARNDATGEVELAPNAAPTIAGDMAMSLPTGYAATATGAYALTGNPAPTVGQDKTYEGKIVYNAQTNKLEIGAGLATGSYPVVLTASNGVDPEATWTFTLTVRPAYAIRLDPAGDKAFPAANPGYGEQTAHGVAIVNDGDQPTGALTIALSDEAGFQLSKTNIDGIAVGASDGFTVAPKTGLAVGDYAATVTVGGANVASQSFAVSFTVAALPPQPVYAIALDPAGDKVFPAANLGYNLPTPHIVRVVNDGDQPTGTLIVSLSDETGFALSATSLDSIAVGNAAVFTVAPKTGLAVGDYAATVTVGGANIESRSFAVSFTVNPALALTITGNRSIVAGDSTTLTASATGGTGAYTYAWSTGATTQSITVAPEATTRYAVTVADQSDDSLRAEATVTVVPPSRTIAVSPAALDFGRAPAGYQTRPAAQSATIANAGNRPLHPAAFAANDAYEITLPADWTEALAPGATRSFTVQPRAGLASGDYGQSLAISASEGEGTRLALAFAVEGQPACAVDLTLTLDGQPFIGQNLSLRAGEIVYPLVEGQTPGAYAGSVPAGAYAIYRNEIDLKREIAVEGSSLALRLDFFTVSFAANGGAPAPADQTVLRGALVAEPAKMERAFYLFEGWYKDAALQTPWDFITDQATATATLYAKWTRDPYYSAIAFTTQPMSAYATRGAIDLKLAAEAIVIPDGTATLTWYRCREDGTTTGKALGTGGEFRVPKTLKQGNYYYLCRASHEKAESLDSAVARVTVLAEGVYPVTRIDMVAERVMEAGESIYLPAALEPFEAGLDSLLWTSDNKTVATVGAKGLVKARRAGTATITATSRVNPSVTASCLVTVRKSGTGTLTLRNLTIALDEIVDLGALYGTAYVWAVDDATKGIVDVLKNGIEGKRQGETIVYGTLTGEKSTLFGDGIELHVTVVSKGSAVRGVQLSEKSFKLNRGKNKLLQATVVPATAGDKRIVWSSSDDYVATVDQSGRVRAINAGTANIIATAANGKRASAKVTVRGKDALPAAPRADRIAITPDARTQKKGERVALTLEISPANADRTGLSWVSSDTNIATVDQDGVVVGLVSGTVTITARLGNLRASCKVTVRSKETPADTLAVYQNVLAIAVGTKWQLDPPGKLTGTWRVKDEKIATVTADGEIAAKKTGETTLTFTASAGKGGRFMGKSLVVGDSLTARLYVVKANKVVTKVKITGQPDVLTKSGETAQLGTQITPANAAHKDIYWESGDTSIAMVDQNGLVTARKEGSVRITAISTSGKSHSITIEIKKAPKAEVADERKATVKKGETLKLKSYLPEGVAARDLRWASSKEKIATVNEKGRLTALKKGKTVVTATGADGVVLRITITVK